MKTAEIRERFLAYFEKHQHQRVASSPLVPHNDATLLFTNAGMVQFKDTFLGAEKRDYVRATTSQRCVRAGGKHNDLENVGYTARHHTFFEMLGNFSFGDYFKRDAIQFAWDFLVKELGLSPEKLWVTVFEEDDEAADIWLKDMGINPQQFSRIGAKDNFWSMGDTGPCGPCSEIFYDHGPDVAGGPPGTPEEDGDRYIEIWNLVFMQYNRDQSGELKPLPRPSVDTGMGLERIAAVMQNKHNNYDIDLFANITQDICRVLGADDPTHHSVRVIADHIRSCAFMIVDGVLPGSEGRGYVLRRIIRRAVRHGYQLGGETPFFHRLVDVLVAEMGEAFPELPAHHQQIKDALEKEEKRFAETLEQGLKIFSQKTSSLSGSTVPGEVAFLLYDTYGFPVDLTADVAREKGLSVDMVGFEREMEAQRERARSSSQFAEAADQLISIDTETEFVGYEQLSVDAEVLAITVEGNEHSQANAGESIACVLDKTCFYAEGGGQIGDQGQFRVGECVVDIVDTRKQANDVFVHYGKVRIGKLNVGDTVNAHVHHSSRRAAECNHSATHLLHAALINVLGTHVQQKGSLVDAQKLRFDFSHDQAVTAEQLIEVEAMVNQQVLANQPVDAELMAIDDAKQAGAAALFGEKYGDTVRVIRMGPFSMELCGGTHVSRTGDIGIVKITGESGVAAGVRRIEAVTAYQAYDYINTNLSLVQQAGAELKAKPADILSKINQLQLQIKTLNKENLDLQKQLATGAGSGSDFESQFVEMDGVKLLTVDMKSVDKAILRETIDRYKSKYDNAVIVLATRNNDKVAIVAGVSKTISKQYPAGKLIQTITGLFDGRGGGRPDMAEGGIPTENNIDACLAAVKDWLVQVKAN
ncbi:MAG: alanine--tRNA ligase [Arenicella sp.]